MRILFISFIDPEYNLQYGGSHGCRRNYLMLNKRVKIFKYIIEKRNNFSSVLSLMEGFFPPERRGDTIKVIRFIEKEKIDTVWFDGSYFGTLAKKIKKTFPSIQLYSYYHNIEADYIDVRIKKGIKHYVYKKSVLQQESLLSEIVTHRIVLSQKDEKRLQELYGWDKRCTIIPVSFKDQFELKRISKRTDNFNGIFVGAYGRANFESIQWYLKSTTLHENVTIRIIGKGFENHKDEIASINSSLNIEIVGTVDDISEYYYEADFVLAPIMIGAGMKVKIAEAMMYGKTIIGTPEAFAGYDVNFMKIGVCTNDVAEMDRAILKCKAGEYGYRFNEYSRTCFVEKYSSEAVDKIFSRLFWIMD